MTSYRAVRRVEFHDTDAAGIMHFSTYFHRMEEVEHELLRHLGTSVVHHDGDRVISWPRVTASCEYLGSAKFEDELLIDVCVHRIGAKSVTYGFEFYVADRCLARGQMTAVCCVIQHGEKPVSIEIPDDLRTALTAYLIEA